MNSRLVIACVARVLWPCTDSGVLIQFALGAGSGGLGYNGSPVDKIYVVGWYERLKVAWRLAKQRLTSR
jgi:hypothetical protein